MYPAIVTIFGPPPQEIDLQESTTAYDNSVVISLSVMAVLAVIVRIWARRIKNAPLGLDDVFIFAALLLELVTMVLTILGGKQGSGNHVWVISTTQLQTIFKILYGYTFIYGTAAAALKLSFVFYFARIFHTGSMGCIFACKDYISVALLVGGVLAWAYPLMIWTVMLGACKPIHYFWDQYTDPHGGSCVDTTLFFPIAGIINLLIDFIILCIPIPCNMRLQIKRPEKFMIICIFMLGGLYVYIILG
ncbi:hypothetical protein AUEXF2481DRAFT_1 [Aureobasidium subglaciale EXF-2481]|uniref:Rhodopsin domain-containing protein n=1 Tax=Aureobasidium subglaciale (strain EXF-2481) TaxID=1043005 RepID=A0A074YQJ0_AURSE|nr:uncharacterized protein AUEXF2481DRAFT_1 [Aureobasidium subglaciale EXF-2481]KER00034.1 hypothetical protein AUEXF2481DRAFT_1 [Aureobasidium subglaciale EXF-2481]